MRNHSDICSICGTGTSKLRFIQVGVPNTINHLRTEILLLWKRQCIQSLCDVLFESKCPNLFLEYFQQGMYCPDCLQIIRDIDLTWKQFMECKRRIKKQSAKARTLLTRNYINRSDKSEVSVIKARISGLQNSYVDDYSAKEVLEMIYLVSNCERGTKKSINQTLTTEGCTEYAISVDGIKEEQTDDEYNDHFDSWGDDWHSENISGDSKEADINNSASLKRTELEINYPNKIKRPRRSRKFYEKKEEEKTDLESESDDFQSNYEEEKLSPKISSDKSTEGNLTILRRQRKLPISDKEWRPPSSSSNKKGTTRGEKLLKQKKKKGFRKIAIDIVKSENSQTAENSKHENKARGIPRPRNLKSDIVLDDTEQVMLQKITGRKCGQKIRSLSKSEFSLALKIAQYTRDSIRKLDLTEEQIQVMFKLKRKVKEKDKMRKSKPPKLEFCCAEENCESMFKIEEQLEGHIRGKHKGETLPFYCTTCPKKFATFDRVKSHRQSRSPKCILKLGYFHFCKICQKGYKTEEELKSHSDNSHQGPNPFSCAFCDTEYVTSTELVRHMDESHSEIPPEMAEKCEKFICDQCGRPCINKDSLKRHVKSHKIMEELFKCIRCKKSFASESALKVHIDDHHAQIVCDVCGKSVNKESLAGHLRYHNDKKYECKLCSKHFRRRDQLTDHERMHSGIRSFICSVCGKAFFTKVILNGHEKIHEPGYVPRKPIRRTKPNRKKKVQPPASVSESNSCDALPLLTDQQNERFQDHQDLLVHNSVIVNPPPNLNYKYEVDYSSGYFYHTMYK